MRDDHKNKDVYGRTISTLEPQVLPMQTPLVDGVLSAEKKFRRRPTKQQLRPTTRRVKKIIGYHTTKL